MIASTRHLMVVPTNCDRLAQQPMIPSLEFPALSQLWISHFPHECLLNTGDYHNANLGTGSAFFIDPPCLGMSAALHCRSFQVSLHNTCTFFKTNTKDYESPEGFSPKKSPSKF